MGFLSPSKFKYPKYETRVFAAFALFNVVASVKFLLVENVPLEER